MQRVEKVVGRVIPLLLDDLDTDRIIPARFLRCVTFEGLGQHAFEDDRKQNPAHAFNQSRFQGTRILVTGRNFGCGSSREHAPQSLLRWGIQAIVAESFAEIFFGNCVGLGIPAVCVDRAALQVLAAVAEQDPMRELVVDLKGLQVHWQSDQQQTSVPCRMPTAAREALTSGQWDFLAQLLENSNAIRNTANRIPYLSDFSAL